MKPSQGTLGLAEEGDSSDVVWAACDVPRGASQTDPPDDAGSTGYRQTPPSGCI